MKTHLTCLTAIGALISSSTAATIASQDFTTIGDGDLSTTTIQSYTGSGASGADLGFSYHGAAGSTGTSAFGVAGGAFTFGDLAGAYSSQAFAGRNADQNGFIHFDTVNLSGFTNVTLNFDFSNRAGSSNSGDDDFVLRILINGTDTVTLANTIGATSGNTAAGSYSYDFNTFGAPVTSAQLLVDVGVEDAGNDGYTLDNISFTGDIASVPEPSSSALIALGGLTLLLRKKR
jgi:hypothetical protein